MKRQRTQCKCDLCKVLGYMRKIQEKLNKKDSKLLEGFIDDLEGSWPESDTIPKAHCK